MLHLGDARRIPLKEGAARLIVSSPPYFGLRSYSDDEREIGIEGTHVEYLDALLEATTEMMRVLSNDGNMFINIGDRTAGAMANRNWEKINTRDDNYTKHESHRAGANNKLRTQKHTTPNVPARSLVGLPWRYALACIDELGLLLRAEIIWSKPNPLPDYSTTRRVARSHEQVFHFTKTPNSYAGSERPVEFLSVWSITPQRSQVKHTAAFPDELVRRLVTHWSEPNDVVLDPFVGSGTTVRIAETLGRQGVGGDIDEATIKAARSITFTDTQKQMDI